MQTHRSNRPSRRRGSVIVLSLIVLTSMMLLGGALYAFASAASRELSAAEDDRQAAYLAEAGVAEAMVALRAGATGEIGSQAAPAFLTGGVVWVQSSDLGDSRFELLAMGMAGSGRAALQVVVEDQSQSPLFYAVLNSRETLTLNSGVMIDSYDSELGTYAAQATNTWGAHNYARDGGDVTSNGDIVLNANATVFGDATPGPGQSVSFATGSYVSGSTEPSPEPFSFPPIPVPVAVSTGPYSAAANSTVSLASGTHGFDSFTLNKAAKLTITGPATLVVGDFTGGKDARLFIDATGGPVTFYVQGNYSHLINFEVAAVPGSEAAVAFMVQGPGDVVFPSSCKVRGAYYVPNANVLFASSCEAWGSFAANRIDMSSSMRFHYDESLAKHWETSGNGDEDPLQLLAWRPAQVPAELMRDRRDPYQVLGVNRAALASPANSWTWAP